MIVRIAVHCCCEPAKRLGWVEIPRELDHPGSINFIAMPRLEVDETGDRSIIHGIAIRTEIQELRIPLGSGFKTIRAVKSAHETIETWRRVKGFIEDQVRVDL
jgi:hypothetical protein